MTNVRCGTGQGADATFSPAEGCSALHVAVKNKLLCLRTMLLVQVALDMCIEELLDSKQHMHSGSGCHVDAQTSSGFWETLCNLQGHHSEQ